VWVAPQIHSVAAAQATGTPFSTRSARGYDVFAQLYNGPILATIDPVNDRTLGQTPPKPECLPGVVATTPTQASPPILSSEESCVAFATDGGGTQAHTRLTGVDVNLTALGIPVTFSANGIDVKASTADCGATTNGSTTISGGVVKIKGIAYPVDSSPQANVVLLDEAAGVLHVKVTLNEQGFNGITVTAVHLFASRAPTLATRGQTVDLIVGYAEANQTCT
jgi:hypothetical protein